MLALYHDWIRDGKPARGLYEDLVSTRAALGLAADECAKLLLSGDHESRIRALERRVMTTRELKANRAIVLP